MVWNSSSVPRRMSRKSGMSPMPSGSSRHTSSVTPGRMVGLIMPTTPRQLENAITPSLLICRGDRLRAGDHMGRGLVESFDQRLDVGAAYEVELHGDLGALGNE